VTLPKNVGDLSNKKAEFPFEGRNIEETVRKPSVHRIGIWEKDSGALGTNETEVVSQKNDFFLDFRYRAGDNKSN